MEDVKFHNCRMNNREQPDICHCRAGCSEDQSEMLQCHMMGCEYHAHTLQKVSFDISSRFLLKKIERKNTHVKVHADRIFAVRG